jgi:hypothetical protein
MYIADYYIRRWRTMMQATSYVQGQAKRGQPQEGRVKEVPP